MNTFVVVLVFWLWLPRGYVLSIPHGCPKLQNELEPTRWASPCAAGLVHAPSRYAGGIRPLRSTSVQQARPYVALA